MHQTSHGQTDPRPDSPSGAAGGRAGGDGAGEAALAEPVVIRLVTPEDPVPEITRLLHRAYAKQMAMGLRPLAGRQDDVVTRRRVNSGECHLAVAGGGAGRIVGIVILNEKEPDEGPAWFRKPEVVSFSQFAVDPDVQGRGIGNRLLETIERRAAALGKAELGLSMAEPDGELRRYYEKRGYRIVGVWKWPYTNYESLIMSKAVGKPGAG